MNNNLDEMLKEAPSLTLEPFARQIPQKTACFLSRKKKPECPRWY